MATTAPLRDSHETGEAESGSTPAVTVIAPAGPRGCDAGVVVEDLSVSIFDQGGPTDASPMSPRTAKAAVRYSTRAEEAGTARAPSASRNRVSQGCVGRMDSTSRPAHRHRQRAAVASQSRHSDKGDNLRRLAPGLRRRPAGNGPAGPERASRSTLREQVGLERIEKVRTRPDPILCGLEQVPQTLVRRHRRPLDRRSRTSSPRPAPARTPSRPRCPR